MWFVLLQNFKKLSPLERIPVLIDGKHVVNDSTIICEYLEDKYPVEASIFGSSSCAYRKSQVRYLEEFCDSKLADVILWKLFASIVIRPGILGADRDKEQIQSIIETDLPAALDALETILSSYDYGAVPTDHLTVGDIALGCMFRNAELVRFSIPISDADGRDRWPLARTRVNAILTSTLFQQMRDAEAAIIRIPPMEQRAAMQNLGFDVDMEVDYMEFIHRSEVEKTLNPFSQIK